jgi:hypothetical protein
MHRGTGSLLRTHGQFSDRSRLVMIWYIYIWIQNRYDNALGADEAVFIAPSSSNLQVKRVCSCCLFVQHPGAVYICGRRSSEPRDRSYFDYSHRGCSNSYRSAADLSLPLLPGQGSPISRL